jgi:hypothetical protein
MTRSQFWRLNFLIWTLAAVGVASIISLIW